LLGQWASTAASGATSNKVLQVGFITVGPASDGTWKIQEQTFPMKSGYTKLAPFGPAVPEKLRKEALALKEKIANGELTVFQGPLKDRDGKLRLAAGKKADSEFLSQMNFLVPGVEGVLK
jgi:basic membrane protein A and related proteins